MDITTCKNLLSQYLPKLKVTDINPIQQGWDSYTLLVNHELIFRFSTRTSVEDQYKKEAWLLPKLTSRLRLKVPEPLFAKLTPPPPLFIGYKIIPGAPLRALDITDNRISTYSYQLGDFLRSLRSFPIQEAYNYVPILDGDNWRRRYIEFSEIIHSRLGTRIGDGVWTKIDSSFETFLNNRWNFNFMPTLIHGDLSSEHILHEETAGLITGVIDWGDSVFGDPAFDLTGLLADYGPSFCDGVIHGVSQSESMLLRAEFYLKLIPFYEALYGLDIGDAKRLEDGLGFIAKNFQNS